MSEKELDSILNEIKNRSADNGESVTENETDEDVIVNSDSVEINEQEQNAEYQKDDTEYSELFDLANEKKPKNKNKMVIIIVAIVVVVAIAVGVFFAVWGQSAQDEPTVSQQTSQQTTEETTKQINTAVNPMTGEQGFNATGQRPVAIVVENAPDARPQWGIETPDILVEGEVEGGISRMLWLYADYNTVPSKVGPIRSARPSFIKFSKLFDAVFIHWGGSHSKGNYVGGYETFSNENVAHIDGMKGGELFNRDTTRSVSSEHRGVLNGEKIESAIKEKGLRTEINEEKVVDFNFYDDVSDLGLDKSNAVNVKFSSRTDTRKFTYNESDGKYHSSDWGCDVSFENVIVLMAGTNYITTPYKGSTTTYVNYNITSGSGYIASNGTYEKINWSATSGSLKITDSTGNNITLNKGNSYLGLASSNNGGSVSF